MKKKVLIAMSGGVDSSVAAFLLKQQGYECIGCTMKLYDNEDIGVSASKTCCSLSDIEDARSVCGRLDIPYYVLNFSHDFQTKVIDKFISEYQKGRTPNPCIDCNKYMKFDKLYERAALLGCDYIATGHYAVVSRGEDGRYTLSRGADETKDQSYVLYQLNQEQLAHTLFPLGSMRKSEIRRIAQEQGFLNARKPDSQDICFVPEGDYAAVIEKYTGKADIPGNFISTDGRILGRHRGISHYTIGQRKGLGVSSDARLYVLSLSVPENTVTLGANEELFGRRLTVSDINWIMEPPAPGECLEAQVKIRYRHREKPAQIQVTGADAARVVFAEPQRAITPGQSAVFYRGDRVIGGGVIEKAL